MSRVYLDTNFLYVHLRAAPAEAAPTSKTTSASTTANRAEEWRAGVLDEMAHDPGVISALVLDELAYRLVLSWLRDEGDPDPLTTYRADAAKVMRAVRPRLSATWKALDALGLELQPTAQPVVDRAKTLTARPGLAPRDAFHAAHALVGDCRLIASSDRGFDRLRGLRRLGPE